MFKRQNSKIYGGVIASLMTLILTVGCGRENQTTPNSTTVAPTQNQITPSPNATASPGGSQTASAQAAQIYLVAERDNKIELVPHSVGQTKSANQNPRAALEEAFNRLLTIAATSNTDESSSIPQGTKLRSLTVKDNTVTVDLTKEFMEGGGTASMQSRLGQIVYTASSLDPKAKVFISVEGKPLTELGGEGLVIDQPMTRETFEQDFQL